MLRNESNANLPYIYVDKQIIVVVFVVFIFVSRVSCLLATDPREVYTAMGLTTPLTTIVGRKNTRKTPLPVKLFLVLVRLSKNYITFTIKVISN